MRRLYRSLKDKLFINKAMKEGEPSYAMCPSTTGTISGA